MDRRNACKHEFRQKTDEGIHKGYYCVYCLAEVDIDIDGNIVPSYKHIDKHLFDVTNDDYELVELRVISTCPECGLVLADESCPICQKPFLRGDLVRCFKYYHVHHKCPGVTDVLHQLRTKK